MSDTNRLITFAGCAGWRHTGNTSHAGVPAHLERLATGPRTGQILALPVEVAGASRP